MVRKHIPQQNKYLFLTAMFGGPNLGSINKNIFSHLVDFGCSGSG